MAEQKQDTRDRTFILLFDVDGTLTAARKKILPEMEKFVKETQKKVVMGIVGVLTWTSSWSSSVPTV